jgi:glycine cleavage system aminomethyltransferase T
MQIEGASILDRDSGKTIGKITSGGPSPCLRRNIAMGYIQSGFHKNGTAVKVVVRSRNQDAVVTKMPFAETRYVSVIHVLSFSVGITKLEEDSIKCFVHFHDP